jgi:hypothetical protein
VVLLDLIGDQVNDFFIQPSLVATYPNVFILIGFKGANESVVSENFELATVPALVNNFEMKNFVVA